MRAVIITTKEEAFHRHLCADLVDRGDVVAVLHPQPRSWTLQERRALRRRQLKRYGFWHFLMMKLARNRFGWTPGWDESRDVQDCECRFFPDVDSGYERLVAPLATSVPDINSAQGLDLVRSFDADVALCSGGPVYGQELIASVPLMLNFHTGISPLYNGSRSIFWTTANGQPQLTGGTLMRMSAAVDGGDVLAHYLPAIERDDTPGSLFMKCMRGGTMLYHRVLDDVSTGANIIGLPQGRPFHLYYEAEWTAYQTLAIERNLRRGLCTRWARPERVYEYWRMGETAEEAFRQALLELILDG